MESNSAWIIIHRMRIPLLVIIITFSISILGMTLIPGVDDQGKPYYMNFFDAFYFVSYMATTIGFGEAPYTFTYPQRLWVSFCIYLTVIGWFYGIGNIIALIQDKKLARELAIARFRNKVQKLTEPFIIILGYNNVTKEIIKRLSLEGIRIVVVDKDESKVEEIELEGFIPEVPAISADTTKPDTLKLAGIHHKNCQAVVVLFEDDVKNAKIALMCKLLNKKINIIVKSTTKDNTEHLRNIGIRHIEDPFKIISNRFYFAIAAPYIWLLEMWIFGHILRIRKREFLPKGKYIICGAGRMGKALASALERAKIEYVFIDIKSSEYKKRKQSAIYGDAEDIKTLIKAGIKEASCIIAGTKDDMINLTILSTAKKLNPSIYTIARENTLEDISVFKSARIDKIYILEKVLAKYTYNFIAKPMANRFIRMIYQKDNVWAMNVVGKLSSTIGKNPDVFEIQLTHETAYALCKELENGRDITLEILRRSRKDYRKKNKIVFLMYHYENEHERETVLMPSDSLSIRCGASLLIACDEEARSDFEYIINNYYELYYVLTGKEQSVGIFNIFQKEKIAF
ncbi:potassium channel family protein [Nitratiruptor tergarcus]|uniref:K+ transport systems, NAD-binding component n=1 Tax=Nitratiruptor tergarcus DSM 16512 TaxID=1069081 RepID=A0A1W1WQH0_9BACT|nr:NAD(P)-binding protein [Nitratiruptor tergarcus]SMC08551.1 K+ transport systems, NAD-binding component [Nitratiruptor tergarcus DSM 16512]